MVYGMDISVRIGKKDESGENKKREDIIVLYTGDVDCGDAIQGEFIGLTSEGGSGCPMFMDNVFLMDEGMLDYQVLVEYMTEYLDGNLEGHYQKTEGRIQIH